MGEVVTVLTFKSVEHIVGDGGTQSWSANRAHLKKCEYVVCARNQNGPYKAEGSEPHRHAFLIGRISNVVDAEDGDGRNKIEFSEYAVVLGPEMPLSGANPVQYHSSLETLGIDLVTLHWTAVEAPPAPLSPIMRAKVMLSAAYDVPVEAIEVHIRM